MWYVCIMVMNKMMMEWYMKECVGNGIEVIIKSVRVVSSECKMMRWMIYHGVNKVEMLMIVIIKRIVERNINSVKKKESNKKKDSVKKYK